MVTWTEASVISSNFAASVLKNPGTPSVNTYICSLEFTKSIVNSVQIYTDSNVNKWTKIQTNFKFTDINAQASLTANLLNALTRDQRHQKELNDPPNRKAQLMLEKKITRLWTCRWRSPWSSCIIRPHLINLLYFSLRVGTKTKVHILHVYFIKSISEYSSLDLIVLSSVLTFYLLDF